MEKENKIRNRLSQMSSNKKKEVKLAKELSALKRLNMQLHQK